MKYFLSIAASDNSGGAGVQQDLKVAGELGFWGLSAVTGITVQNFKKLENIYPLPPEILSGQIMIDVCSFHISCVKIGAICSEDNILAISKILRKNKMKNVVLDPVFAPSHGKEFIKSKSVRLFREELFPLVNIVTPNRSELSLIAEKEVLNFEDGVDISKNLATHYRCNIYLKGGHFEGKSVNEALITGTEVTFFEKERLNLKYSHGTGCTFSAALSCYLGEGMNLKNACKKASNYVNNKYNELGNLLK